LYCIFSAELTKIKRTPSDWFFGDFAHWDAEYLRRELEEVYSLAN